MVNGRVMETLLRSARPTLRRSSVGTDAFIAMLARGENITRVQAWLIVATCFAGATLLNLAVGGALSPLPGFLITIFIAGWCIGESAGLACAIAAAGMVSLIHGSSFGRQQGAPPPGDLAAAWNVGARTIIMILVALAANALRVVVERERWRARVDGLTGALNKDAFREGMAALIPRARRIDGALVVAYMDLDGFKGVNDRHGHAAGDRVLAAFAQGAANAIRSHDLFARIGGDEFVALLAVRSCEEGHRVATMLHDRLRAILSITNLPVTCSMGAVIADARTVANDDGLIEMADKLLYQVKRSGKDALRIGRVDGMGPLLKEAFPVLKDGQDEFTPLLRTIDRRTQPALERTAA